MSPTATAIFGGVQLLAGLATIPRASRRVGTWSLAACNALATRRPLRLGSRHRRRRLARLRRDGAPRAPAVQRTGWRRRLQPRSPWLELPRGRRAPDEPPSKPYM